MSRPKKVLQTATAIETMKQRATVRAKLLQELAVLDHGEALVLLVDVTEELKKVIGHPYVPTPAKEVAARPSPLAVTVVGYGGGGSAKRSPKKPAKRAKKKKRTKPGGGTNNGRTEEVFTKVKALNPTLPDLMRAFDAKDKVAKGRIYAAVSYLKKMKRIRDVSGILQALPAPH